MSDQVPTQSGPVGVPTFAAAEARTLSSIVVTLERVKANSSTAHTASTMLRFTKSGQVLVRTFCRSRGPDLIAIVVTLERVEAKSSRARTTSKMFRFTKSGQILVRTSAMMGVISDSRDPVTSRAVMVTCSPSDCTGHDNSLND